MNVRTVLVLCVLCLAGSAGPAAADPADNCQSACVQQCLAQGARKCGNVCVQMCRQDVTAPQTVFSGPVTSTPLCASSVGEQCGFFVKGTAADQSFCPGTVTFYAVCPGGEPETNVIGTTEIAADCTFSLTMPSTYSGDNGCYGLVAVTPPASADGNTGLDPGWSTCTGGACPTPAAAR
jgi:hypothetical protein